MRPWHRQWISEITNQSCGMIIMITSWRRSIVGEMLLSYEPFRGFPEKNMAISDFFNWLFFYRRIQIYILSACFVSLFYFWLSVRNLSWELNAQRKWPLCSSFSFFSFLGEGGESACGSVKQFTWLQKKTNSWFLRAAIANITTNQNACVWIVFC